MAAEAAISSVVELLGNLLIEKVKYLRGVEGKVQSLKEELEWMQTFLKEANKRQAEDEGVRNWIKKIREAAQDAEDAIEMFLVNVENEKRRSLVKRCASCPKRMYHTDIIGEEIDSIRTRLDGIDKSRERYGIKGLAEAAAAEDPEWRLQVESQRRLSHWKKDEQVVGMDADVEKLLEESILCDEKKGLSIAVLEGMGGIGKSTLAREVYNHPDVAGDRFDRRAWVVVSSDFTPYETIKQLILELQSSEEDKRKLAEEIKKLKESNDDKLYVRDQLKQMLHNQLEGESYFIVLDDVWEKEHLESLIASFPNQKGITSRLLVTTRNKIITKYDQYLHKMKLLDREQGWELLLKKAFIDSTNGKCPEELETIGSQILENCHGLPLAISVVGGLLVGKETKSGWQQVLNQINSYLGRADISTILELSYQNLSPRLRSCFLCLAFFKEDSIIPAQRLVHIWVTQGLIKQEGSMSIDDIGRGHLNELINRSMLEIQDLAADDRVKNCHLHDLVRDVCLRKAKEEIGLEVVKQGEEGITSESSYKPRHRVVYGQNLETFSSTQNKHIRSLFLLNVEGYHNNALMTTPSEYWKSYQLLKTLDLDGFAFETLPDSFRSLIGLKCLRIHNSYLTLELPSWLGHLTNLEVLDMENCPVKLPRQVSFKMDSLRFFHANIILLGPTKKISWKNITCLKHISHKDWMRCASNLTSGSPIRELSIIFDGWTERDELSEVRASLEKMENLVTLRLMGTDNIPDIAVAMPNDLANLSKLKLGGKLPKCPTASMFPPNLSHLALELSYLDDDPMAELGKLSKLHCLKLQMGAYWGETMQVLRDGFPSLEALTLGNLPKLKGIVVNEGGMPQLKHLRIRNCPDLETKNLPEHINIDIS